MVDLYFADYGDWSYSNRRKTPVYNTIDDYAYNIYVNDYRAFDKIVNNVNNFNFGDGVNTEHYINYVAGQKTDYSYMLITEAGSHEVMSRWFVLDCYMQRNGQLRITLRRDVLADINQQIYYGENLFYCERGILSQTDKYIYNSENGNYNQVKASQVLLKDGSRTPWIVGYMAVPKAGDEDIQVNVVGTNTDLPIVSLNSLSDLPGYAYSNLVSNHPVAIEDISNVNMKVQVRTADEVEFYEFEILPNNNDKYKTRKYSIPFGTTIEYTNNSTQVSKYNTNVTASLIYEEYCRNHRTEFTKSYMDYIGMPSDSDITKIQTADMALYKVGNKLYKAKVTRHTNSPYGSYVSPGYTTAAGTAFRNIWNLYVVPRSSGFGKLKQISDDYGYGSLQTQGIMTWYDITYTETTNTQGQGNFAITSSRRKLLDQPFSMFAIPCREDFLNSTGNKIGCSLAYGQEIASAISTATSGRNGFLYDIQLLPYSPLQDKLINGTLNMNGMTEGVDYTRVKDNNTTKAYLFWCNKSTFSFKITLKKTISDYKLSNELEFCRLQSPNMASSFQFSPAKNEGIRYIKVDCTYKPYQPYIHLAPDFRGLYSLYGTDFETGVGLICSGDFSLPMTTDGWAEFMRNNVNYENVFSRQIENMEVKNSISRTMEGVQIATGALQGAGSGALLGSMFGPVGTGIGAAVGGVASLGGGIADKYYNEKLRAEEMDYTKDLHEMNTQNIQALPDTLTKVGSFTANNLIFPFIEYYKATDDEYEALKQKIRWYGMNVGRVGKFYDFTSSNEYDYVSRSFVKGNFLRIAHNGYDDHFKNAVNEELSKGVYV